MKYEKYSVEEMRSLIILNEIEENELTEEDYTAILDNEYCKSNINTEVINFCVTGLQKLDKYSSIHQPDIDVFLKLPSKSKRIKLYRTIIGGIAAAIAVASMICAAFGNDIFGFYFSEERDNLFINYVSDNTASTSNIYECEEKIYRNLYDVPPEIIEYVPKYILESFTFAEAHLIKKENDDFNIFFEKEDFRFSLNFHEINSASFFVFPKDDADVYQDYCTNNNNNFKVFANDNSYTAIVETDNKLLSIHSNTDYDTFLYLLEEIPKF